MIYIWALVGLIVTSSIVVYLVRFNKNISEIKKEGEEFEILE
jgi:hypothetical protein